MIPKIIHYCWFGGGKKGEYFEQCIKSWRQFCPDFKIIEWNETNFDIGINTYCKEAYEQGKYAFVSDVCRVFVLKKYGGIYFDTDVELLKDISELLELQGFMGCEDANYIATGLGCGFEPEHPFLRKLLDYYSQVSFINDDGSLNLKSCPEITTTLLCGEERILFNTIKTINDIMIFPQRYFSPSDFWLQVPMINKETYAIHHYEASWIPDLLSSERNMCQREKGRVVFVSPHYDDAVGSCGGWISHLIDNDIVPTILTIFGKKYDENKSSKLIQTIQNKWKSEDVRERENMKACDILRCEYKNYDNFECIYRKCNDEFLYPNIGDEFDKLHPNDLELINELHIKIKTDFDWPRVFYFPASIGHQVDHVIVNEVGKRLLHDGYNVLFYQDFTYEGAIPDEYVENTYALSNDVFLKKIEAINAYESQVSMLFGNKETFEKYMNEHGKTETFYRLVK